MAENLNEAAEEERFPLETGVYRVCKEGDVILVVGPERFKIQVNSMILKLASPVFMAMFDSSFSESQRLKEATASEPVEIEFPEDDHGAFLLAVQVLHFTRTFGRDEPGADTLLKFAVLVDKYDLISALSFTSRGWLSKTIDDALNKEMTMSVSDKKPDSAKEWKLVQTAFILRDRKAFFHFTRKLIITYSGSFLDLADHQPCSTWIVLKGT